MTMTTTRHDHDHDHDVHGVFGSREEMLLRMRRIAKAPTVEMMEEAIKDFKGSSLWIDNPRLSSWFEEKWLPAKKV